MNTGLNSFGLSVPAAAVVYFAARAALALVLGACIGAERQWRQRGAGLRTNALVSLGAALFKLLAVFIEGEHGADPTRIAAYIVSGVGFLGGGVILRHGMNVTGINTAATIWCSAAVGTLSGAGYPLEAAIGALLIVIVHLALRPVARRIDRLPDADKVETIYRFRAVCRAKHEAHIRALVIQALTGGEFHLRAARSSDLVAVEAEADPSCTTKTSPRPWPHRAQTNDHACRDQLAAATIELQTVLLQTPAGGRRRI